MSKENKTKEEVLWSFPQGESEPYGHAPVNRIYEAMDQWAEIKSKPLLEALKELLKQYRKVYGFADMPLEDYRGTVVTNAENAILNAEGK